MPHVTSRNAATMILVAVAAGGCGPRTPSTSSPVTSADSEAGRRARAEDDRFLRERQEREARARRRAPGLAPTAFATMSEPTVISLGGAVLGKWLYVYGGSREPDPPLQRRDDG